MYRNSDQDKNETMKQNNNKRFSLEDLDLSPTVNLAEKSQKGSFLFKEIC